MPNTNCLQGLRCPECDSEGPFYIECRSLFTVYDDGATEFSDLEWEDDAFIQCYSCEHEGKVKDFKLEGNRGLV